MIDPKMEMAKSALDSDHTVLLLGQRYLALRDDLNPLIVSLGNLDGNREFDFSGWWFQGDESAEEKRRILSSIGRAVSADLAVESMLRWPWKCVFTSSIDPTASRLLTVEKRRNVHEIFNPGFDIGRQADLKLVRLFGSVERPSSTEWPPLDLSELRQRRSHAVQLLAPLGETVSPSGFLLIEGWDPGRDWLRARDLASGLADLVDGQALIFGIDPTQELDLLNDEDFGDLIEAGVVTLFRQRLADILQSLEQQGELPNLRDLGLISDTVALAVAPRTPDSLERLPESKAVRVQISQDEWRRLSETMTIIEPLRDCEKLPQSDPDRYSLFREFVGSRPEAMWPFLREIAFRRPILDREIKPLVQDCLSQSAPQDQAVILYGQAASGKTVLLNLLALELREAGFPVIYASRGIVPIDRSHIDVFCRYVESVSSIPVVVIYDASEREGDYLDLASYLASLGRKCLVIGSAYGPEESSKDSLEKAGEGVKGRRSTAGRRRHRRYGSVEIREIDVPVVLDDVERGLLVEHIQKFVPIEERSLRQLLDAGYDSFFTLLYWLLPPSRQRIEELIVTELDRATQAIQRAIDELGDARGGTDPATNMELAVRQVLGEKLDELLDVGNSISSSEAVALSDDVGVVRPADLAGIRLINAVMLASRSNLLLPQELALRLIRQNFRVYRECMQRHRVLVEIPIGLGLQIGLSARHRLEAIAWIHRHLRGSNQQIDLLTEVVNTIRSHEMEDEKSPELNFVIKMLQSLGPQGEKSIRLEYNFLDIAKVVEGLRQTFVRVHPRLLLIQGNCTREWVQQEQRALDRERLGLDPDDWHQRLRQKIREEWLPRLNDAEKAVSAARDAVHPENRRLHESARQLMSVLHTERAAVFGVQLGCLRRLFQSSAGQDSRLVGESDDLLSQARTAWRESLQFNEDNFRALDVACWILHDRYTMEQLSRRSRVASDSGSDNVATDGELELLVEWNDIIDRYGMADLTSSQVDKREEREGQLAEAMGDDARIEALVQTAEARGSSSGYTLVARIIENRSPESKLPAGESAARRYLEDHCEDRLLEDQPVLLLYSRLWWETETHLDGYFPEERLLLGFSRGQWERLAELSQARLQQPGERENGTALFHLGWALMQLGQPVEADRVFRQLQILNIGGSRRSRALALLTDATGKPRHFGGDVRGVPRETHGYVWVNELQMDVPFNPAEFEMRNPRMSEAIPPFHIALNYRGPYAEPQYRLRAHEAKRKVLDSRREAIST